jgi:hypothetical protein
MNIEDHSHSSQSDLKTIDHDQRLDGTEGILMLDTGAVIAVRDWVINLVVTRSGDTSWTARFHVPSELAIPSLLSAHRAAGQFLNGEQVKFLGTLVSVQREQQTMYCVCQGEGHLQVEAS